MKVILCGGRDHGPFTPVQHDWLARLAQASTLTEVITGGAPGADTHGAAWAEQQGLPTVTFWANWQGEGRAAGPQRNARMLRYLLWACQTSGEEGRVLAFRGGAGTQNMVRQAEEASVLVMRWQDYAVLCVPPEDR